MYGISVYDTEILYRITLKLGKFVTGT